MASFYAQALVNQKALGSATEGVPLDMLKTSVCSAYTGPKSFYPAECVKLAGEQKQFASDDTVVNKENETFASAEGKPQANIVLAKKVVDTEVRPPVVKSRDGAVVGMKEAAISVAAKAETSGKVQMEMYWRAFWYALFRECIRKYF